MSIFLNLKVKLMFSSSIFSRSKWNSVFYPFMLSVDTIIVNISVLSASLNIVFLSLLHLLQTTERNVLWKMFDVLDFQFSIVTSFNTIVFFLYIFNKFISSFLSVIIQYFFFHSIIRLLKIFKYYFVIFLKIVQRK